MHLFGRRLQTEQEGWFGEKKGRSECEQGAGGGEGGEGGEVEIMCRLRNGEFLQQ